MEYGVLGQPRQLGLLGQQPEPGLLGRRATNRQVWRHGGDRYDPAYQQRQAEHKQAMHDLLFASPAADYVNALPAMPEGEYGWSDYPVSETLRWAIGKPPLSAEQREAFDDMERPMTLAETAQFAGEFAPGAGFADYMGWGASGGPSFAENVQSGDYVAAGMQTADAGADLLSTIAPWATVPAMFLGVGAKTADMAKLRKAKRMKSDGVGRQKIWDETGWFEGADGKWRFEIDDSGSYLQRTGDGPASEMMAHDELFQAYPDAGAIHMVLRGGDVQRQGTYQPHVSREHLGLFDLDEMITAEAKVYPERKEIALHELQHAVQNREGLAAGGSPFDDDLTSYGRQIAQAINAKYEPELDALRRAGKFDESAALDAKRQAEVKAVFDRDKAGRYGYEALAGEVEARNVAERYRMTPEQRAATPPWETEDVPADQQIVRMGGGGAAMVVPPDVAIKSGIPLDMPKDPNFAAAIKATPGAEVTPDGVKLTLSRGQMPEQSGLQSVRGGVFYLPKGDKNARYYGGKNGYGGAEKIEGETLFRRPMFVKGATGGKAPQTAFDTINGKGAYEAMRGDALKVYGGYGARSEQKVQLAEEFLDQYAPEMSYMADDIVRNSSRGNQLAYALQEAAVSSAVRGAGYDGILGYSIKRSGDKSPFISEVFDVREDSYPTPHGGFSTWPEYEEVY